jgi:hypothetical protein
MSLLPLGLLLRDRAFRHPEWVESIYGQAAYPWIAGLFGGMNRTVPFSAAESILLLLAAAFLARLGLRRRRVSAPRNRLGTASLRALTGLWIGAGAGLLAFLILWGLNYARPSLERKMSLATSAIAPEEILALGRRAAAEAALHYRSLGASPGRPSKLPLTFRELDEAVDDALGSLGLPGLAPVQAGPSKRLLSSGVLSRFGLSGVFIPFTGEPSINALVPDCALPMVVAHEKAHQLGVAQEGEASLVAFMTCSRAGNAYLSYTAYFDAALRLIGAAARTDPEGAREALESLGPGPLEDLEALRSFWARYEGPLSRGAEKVNDTYLKSFRVQEGVGSYGRVVELLMALDRQNGFE